MEQRKTGWSCGGPSPERQFCPIRYTASTSIAFPGSAPPVGAGGPAEHSLPPLLPGDCPPPGGRLVEVTGEIRSFNNRSGVGNRLVITVLARSVVPGEGDPCNQVFLHGVLCKPRFCGAPPWVGISATCSWRSTAVTAGPTISPASPGAAWLCSAASFRQGMPSGWTDGCRAAPTSKPSGRPPRSAPHLKSPSPAWRFQRSCPRKPICGKPEAS